MKKVVLLAGVLAAGMAIAPQDAQATTPGVQEVPEAVAEDTRYQKLCSVLSQVETLIQKYDLLVNSSEFKELSEADKKTLERNYAYCVEYQKDLDALVHPANDDFSKIKQSSTLAHFMVEYTAEPAQGESPLSNYGIFDAYASVQEVTSKNVDEKLPGYLHIAFDSGLYTQKFDICDLVTSLSNSYEKDGAKVKHIADAPENARYKALCEVITKVEQDIKDVEDIKANPAFDLLNDKEKAAVNLYAEEWLTAYKADLEAVAHPENFDYQGLKDKALKAKDATTSDKEEYYLVERTLTRLDYTCDNDGLPGEKYAKVLDIPTQGGSLKWDDAEDAAKYIPGYLRVLKELNLVSYYDNKHHYKLDEQTTKESILLDDLETIFAGVISKIQQRLIYLADGVANNERVKTLEATLEKATEAQTSYQKLFEEYLGKAAVPEYKELFKMAKFAEDLELIDSYVEDLTALTCPKDRVYTNVNGNGKVFSLYGRSGEGYLGEDKLPTEKYASYELFTKDGQGVKTLRDFKTGYEETYIKFLNDSIKFDAAAQEGGLHLFDLKKNDKGKMEVVVKETVFIEDILPFILNNLKVYQEKMDYVAALLKDENYLFVKDVRDKALKEVEDCKLITQHPLYTSDIADATRKEFGKYEEYLNGLAKELDKLLLNAYNSDNQSYYFNTEKDDNTKLPSPLYGAIKVVRDPDAGDPADYNPDQPGTNVWRGVTGYDEVAEKAILTNDPAPEYFAKYWEAFMQGGTCLDVYNAIVGANAELKKSIGDQLQQKAGDLDPSQIQGHNVTVYESIVNTDEYKHIAAIYEEAKSIIPVEVEGETEKVVPNDLYAYDIYAELIKNTLDETEFLSAVDVVANLLSQIEKIKENNVDVVSEYVFVSQIETTYPQLEGKMNAFKKEANTVAAQAIKGYMEARNIDGENGVIAELQHHVEEYTGCFNLEKHVITEAEAVIAAKQTLVDNYGYLTESEYGTINPDVAWNEMPHTLGDVADRVLSTPAAVDMWNQIQGEEAEEKPWHLRQNGVDRDLNAYETAIYKTCLTWDKEDIKSAIDELVGEGYIASLEGASETVAEENARLGAEIEVSVDAELKEWLNEYFVGHKKGEEGSFQNNTGNELLPTADNFLMGTVASNQWVLFHEADEDFAAPGTAAALIADDCVTISRAEFERINLDVTILETRLAQFKANWKDIKTLNDEMSTRRLEIVSAAAKNGYDATLITEKWGGVKPAGVKFEADVDTATGEYKAEYKEHEDLLLDVKSALFTVASLYPEIAPLDLNEDPEDDHLVYSWEQAMKVLTDAINLEKDHHAWLAAYQKANYEAYVAMKEALTQRRDEFYETYYYKIGSTETDATKNENALGYYTTEKNKDVNLAEIKGEADTSKYIYANYGEDHLGFLSIYDHFGTTNENVSDQGQHYLFVKDGEGNDTADVDYTYWSDLMFDRVNQWYHEGDAEFIGPDSEKNYYAEWQKTVDGQLVEDEHDGKKILNTVDGLNITPIEADAENGIEASTGICTFGTKDAPLVLEKDQPQVIFGWLQKEIHENFATAMDNEKANRDIHDSLDEVDGYIQDTKDNIENAVVSTVKVTPVEGAEDKVEYLVPEKKIQVYRVNDPELADDYRVAVEETFEAIKWNNRIKADGSAYGPFLGVGNYSFENLLNAETGVTALDVEEAIKEGELPAITDIYPNYKNEKFDCAYGDELWGWNKLEAVMTNLHDLEKVEYDRVASVALRDGDYKMKKYGEEEEKTLAETLASTKLFSDSIANAAYTQLYLNNLAYVYQELDRAKAWAKDLDIPCHESKFKPCSEVDITNNPCGWDEKDAQAALKAIVEAWNAKLALVKENHDKGVNDDEAQLEAMQAYVVEALNAIRGWQEKFAKADMAHKQALLEAYDIAIEEVNTLESYAKIAGHDYVNFSTSDKAAADAWTVDFSQRVLGTYDGEEVTFQQFVQKIFKNCVELWKIDFSKQNPNQLAAAQKVADQGVGNFKEYIEATDCLNDLLKETVYGLFHYHLYTELKQLAEALKGFNLEADYMVYVNENRAESLLLTSRMQALLTAINTTKSDVSAMGDDECDETMLLKLADLYDKVLAVEGDIKAAYFTDKAEEGATYDATYVKTLAQQISLKLYGYESELTGIKTDIANFADRVRTSQHAADNILDKMIDFEFLLQQARSLKGADVFKTKNLGQYNTEVSYFEDIDAQIQELKDQVVFDNSHEGEHSAFDNYNAYVAQIQAIKDQIKALEAAIAINEAAHDLVIARYNELDEAATAAYNFWTKYCSEETLADQWAQMYMNAWKEEVDGVVEDGTELAFFKAKFHSYYLNGVCAEVCTVDGLAQELNETTLAEFKNLDDALANSRNQVAKIEADIHWNHVNNAGLDLKNGKFYGEYYKEEYPDAYTTVTTVDPFIEGVWEKFLEEYEGEYGVITALAWYKQQIQEAYEAGELEAALKLDYEDNPSIALGIHQQLNGAAGVIAQLEEEYTALFESAHHLGNGKTLYSDQQYVTIGFFREANEGLGNQAQEMFNEVVVNFNAEEGNIGIFDTNWLNVTDWDDVNNTPDNWFDDVPAGYERDSFGHLVHQEGFGVVPAQIGVLQQGNKKNELSFILNDEKGYEVVTLAAGPADITFQPGSLVVDGWKTNHNVYIEVNVAAPEVETVDAPVATGSNKLIVRLDNPIDLTYTINSLVARTDDGTEFSYADRVINYAAGQLEFILPEGTKSVELPEGFFTFRTGENSIVRSAAMTVTVGGTTSIEALLAMGDKAQIFDLQGRRVKAEALISGNTYVVNGEKVMVK